MLIAYFPMYWAIRKFFPNYSNSLPCFFILIPIVIIQGKNNCIYSTLYKLYGLEKHLLFNLLYSLIVFVGSTFVLFFIEKSIVSVAIATFIGVLFRLIVNNLVFNLKFRNTRIKSSIVDIIVQMLFIASAVVVGFGVPSLVFTVGLFFVYLVIDFRRIYTSLKYILALLRRKKKTIWLL